MKLNQALHLGSSVFMIEADLVTWIFAADLVTWIFVAASSELELEDVCLVQIN